MIKPTGAHSQASACKILLSQRHCPCLSVESSPERPTTRRSSPFLTTSTTPCSPNDTQNTRKRLRTLNIPSPWSHRPQRCLQTPRRHRLPLVARTACRCAPLTLLCMEWPSEDICAHLDRLSGLQNLHPTPRGRRQGGGASCGDSVHPGQVK